MIHDDLQKVNNAQNMYVATFCIKDNLHNDDIRC
jgi:hypothetical protein